MALIARRHQQLQQQSKKHKTAIRTIREEQPGVQLEAMLLPTTLHAVIRCCFMTLCSTATANDLQHHTRTEAQEETCESDSPLYCRLSEECLP
eukprot:4914-Heterococcus_DN1.PRE.2